MIYEFWSDYGSLSYQHDNKILVLFHRFQTISLTKQGIMPYWKIHTKLMNHEA